MKDSAGQRAPRVLPRSLGGACGGSETLLGGPPWATWEPGICTRVQTLGWLVLVILLVRAPVECCDGLQTIAIGSPWPTSLSGAQRSLSRHPPVHRTGQSLKTCARPSVAHLGIFFGLLNGHLYLLRPVHPPSCIPLALVLDSESSTRLVSQSTRDTRATHGLCFQMLWSHLNLRHFGAQSQQDSLRAARYQLGV